MKNDYLSYTIDYQIFFKTFFDIDTNDYKNLSKIKFPTFEEVLGILELAINRQESFKGFDLNSSDGLQKIRERLLGSS